MKFNYKLLFIAFVLILGYSCSDLEEDTSSLLTLDNLSTNGDVEASLAPIYRQLLQMHLLPHRTRITTYGADDITTWAAGNKAPIRVFDRFDYGDGENSDIVWLPHAWDGYWRTIYYCNTLIDALKTASVSEEIKALADAEARTFRAYSYLHLVKTWGNMPLILDGSVPTGEEQRATVLANYEQIESDLIIAEASLLQPGMESPGRITVSFAKSILSDLYLTWAGWPAKDNSKYQLAAAKSKEIIDSGYHELVPIENLWTLEGALSRESIFSLKHADDQTIDTQVATAFTFHQGRGFSDCFPELQFFNDFPEGPRKNATFITDIPNRTVAGGLSVPSNPPTIPWPDSDRGHPMYKKYLLAEDLTFNSRPITFRATELYRYAEILLIYAEAQSRIGENSSSIEALNQVKRRAAGLPYLAASPAVDVSSATPDEIVDEKGWELAAEYKRWFDLVRTERVAEIAAKRDSSEPVQLVRNPSEAQYIMPIPFNSVVLSNLEQNPQGFVVE